jgi:hypothetical protein
MTTTRWLPLAFTNQGVLGQGNRATRQRRELTQWDNSYEARTLLEVRFSCTRSLWAGRPSICISRSNTTHSQISKLSRATSRNHQGSALCLTRPWEPYTKALVVGLVPFSPTGYPLITSPIRTTIMSLNSCIRIEICGFSNSQAPPIARVWLSLGYRPIIEWHLTSNPRHSRPLLSASNRNITR